MPARRSASRAESRPTQKCRFGSRRLRRAPARVTCSRACQPPSRHRSAPPWLARRPRLVPEARSAWRSRSRALFGRPSRSRNRFSGFRSRWTMPRAWAAARASATAPPISMALRGGSGPRLTRSRELLALEQLRDDVRLPVGRADVVNAQDVGMRELARGLGLDLEAAEPLRIGGEAGGQGLDRHLAAEPRIASAIDLAHPAGADWRDDFVRSEPGSGGNSHHATRACSWSVRGNP